MAKIGSWESVVIAVKRGENRDVDRRVMTRGLFIIATSQHGDISIDDVNS